MPHAHVAEVMTTDVLALAPDTAWETAVWLMGNANISGAPVIDASGYVVGMVSKTDLLLGSPGETAGRATYYRMRGGAIDSVGTSTDSGPALGGVVADIMTPFAVSVPPSATVLEAMRAMVREKVHRLPVVESGRLMGILTTMDVMRAIVELTDGT